MTHMTSLSIGALSVRLLPLLSAALIACDDDTASGGKRDASNGAHDDDSGHAADSGHAHDAAAGSSKLSFFVSSDTSMTGDLGGLAGADARCAQLAKDAGASGATWHAYLSIEKDAAGKPVDARDRIGKGPWYNAKGVLLAQDLAALHARTGDAEVFLDEHGEKINGQWPGSPMPVEHDVLTGSGPEGTLLAGTTCADWTSAEPSVVAQVGHTDGLGPSQNPNPPYSSWNSAHANAGCDNTVPRGGAGRLYCFAID
jgi:hypothetical protein